VQSIQIYNQFEIRIC